MDRGNRNTTADTHTFIALVEIAHARALFDDFAYEFVPADEARRALQVASVIVQVGPLWLCCGSACLPYRWLGERDGAAGGRAGVRTHRAVDVTFRIASVGFSIFGHGLSSTATWRRRSVPARRALRGGAESALVRSTVPRSRP